VGESKVLSQAEFTEAVYSGRRVTLLIHDAAFRSLAKRMADELMRCAYNGAGSDGDCQECGRPYATHEPDCYSGRLLGDAASVFGKEPDGG